MRKKTKEINSWKTIIGKDEKYHEKVRNVLLYLPKEQVEEFVEIDKSMNPEGLVNGKHNFNRYGTIISFISNFLIEVIDADEMDKMLFNSEMSLTVKSMI